MPADKRTVYLETSIISYLAARPSRDLVTAAHQQVTHEWWDTRRFLYDVYVSEFVVKEAAAGDQDAAERRLRFLDGVSLLEVTNSARMLATKLIQIGPLPVRATTDAFHIAVAATQGVDYLLTWNCAHIANADLWRSINATCEQYGFALPFICTPDELMGEEYDVERPDR